MTNLAFSIADHGSLTMSNPAGQTDDALSRAQGPRSSVSPVRDPQYDSLEEKRPTTRRRAGKRPPRSFRICALLRHMHIANAAVGNGKSE
jgi:hypothetical protein